MAEKFIALKCPQCGSPESKEISDDKFQCLSCNAIYLEDKEKVEVHVKHTYQNNPATPTLPISRRKTLLILFLVPIAFILLSTVISLFKNKNPHRSVFSADVYDMENTANHTINSGGKPLYLVPVYRHKRDKDNECLVIKTFDPKTKKLISEITVIDWMNSQIFSSKGYQEFSGEYIDSTFYLLVAEKLFALNTSSLTVKDKSAELISTFPQLSSGIAKVEKLYYENGFNIKANDGLIYYYFPKANKLYDDKTYQDLRNNPPSSCTMQTKYHFDAVTSGDRQHLYKIERKEDADGPRDYYGTNEIKTDLTPDRIFFDGSVAYMDAENIIVAYKADANDKIGHSIQCLDKTGKIKWSTPPIYFSVSQWTYPLRSLVDGFLIGNIAYLNDRGSSIAIDMKNGSVLWQNYFSEDVFRESVK